MRSPSNTGMISSNGSGLTWSWSFESSRISGWGMMSGRMLRSWPNFTNVGPNSSKVFRMRSFCGIGCAGVGFAELVVRGGSAARLFGLQEGDEPFVPTGAPALAV